MLHLPITTYCLQVGTKKILLIKRFDTFKESKTKKDYMI